MKRNAQIDGETVLGYAQTPIDPAELAGLLDVPHAALGRVLRRLVDNEQLRWVWNDARTRSLCLDARIPCPEGYTEGLQGQRLRDKGGPAPKPFESAAPVDNGAPVREPTATPRPPANDARPTGPSRSPADTGQDLAKSEPGDAGDPGDPVAVLTHAVRRAGHVRRLALARSGAARAGLTRADTEAMIDRLIAQGDLIETQAGNTRWLAAPATTTPETSEPKDPRSDAPEPAKTPAAGDAPPAWMSAVLRAVLDLGTARRDQIESLARAPGVGGASANIASATDTLEADGLIQPARDGRWRVTDAGARQLHRSQTRPLPATRLTAVRDQPDLRTPTHEQILAAHGRTTGAVRLRDIGDRTGADVRDLLHAAAHLEAVDALERSRDKRSPATVTIRSAWRNARLCGPEHAPVAARSPSLDATTARALLVVTGLGYATAADLDAPKLRRRWDVSGHGAEQALRTLRELGLAHGPDRMGRWFPTDAGADAESEISRVVGQYRPESLARHL